MTRALTLALYFLPCFAAAAAASDLGDFNAAVDEAYGHYRGAVFYLHTGNPAVANLELQEAVAIWDARVMPFRDAPPDAFADDAAWAVALDGLAARLIEAEAATARDDAETAEAALLPLREELAALRARNHVRSFSDCIDEANRAMDALWEFRHAPPDFDDAAAVDSLKARTAVTTYLYERCLAEAPPEIAEAPEFKRIMEGALTSLGRLWPNIQERNQEGVINILRELRSFDRLLWLQFG